MEVITGVVSSWEGMYIARLILRQMGNHNFPHHLVLWLSFQVTTTPFCKCLSQTPLVSTATKLMPVLPVAHLNIACFYFSVSSPIIGLHMWSRSADKLIHPRRKHFLSLLCRLLGVHSLYHPLIPLHLHCTIPYLKFTLKRNHTRGGGKSPNGWYVFSFKREFIIYLSWKKLMFLSSKGGKKQTKNIELRGGRE